MKLLDRILGPKFRAKQALKQNLKNKKWASDYNQALKDLGVGQKLKTSVNVPGPYGRYNYSFISSGSGGAKWHGGLSATGRTRFLDHYELRQNARDAFHDSIDARALIERFADSIVDTGLILDSSPIPELLGIDPEEAEQWGAEVSRRFHLWAKDKKQNRSGMMSFYQAQRLYEIFQQRDNDIFVRLYYSKSSKLQNPLQFEFVDANQIRGYAYTTTYSQYNHDDGIIRNSDGTERAFKVWVSNPGKIGEYKDLEITRIGEKSGKVMMIHGFNPEYAGQRRGYSRIGFALQELENITDFSLSIIKKAINQSLMLMSVENMQQDAGNPLEGISSDQLVSAMGNKITQDPTTEELTEADRTLRVCPIPEAGLDTPGSTAFVGNQQGDTVRLLQNSTPAESYREFVGAFLERLAAAAGIPVEVVLMKFGNNYSASRATLVLAWRVFQLWREEMAVDFLNIVFEAWLGGEIAAGRISAPGFSDPRLRAAWLNCQWIGSRMPDIDPGRTAKAAKDNLEMNLTTGEREARNLNGSSFKDNLMKNRKDFDDMPVPPWGKGKTPGQAIDDKFAEMDENNQEEEEE